MIASLPPPAPEPVILRPARADEHPRIIDCWLKSYEDGPFAALFSRGRFVPSWRPVVTELIARSRLTVLSPADEPEAMVYGWSCWEPGERARLHYLHVRASSRRLGYALKLLSVLPAEIVCTHPTREGQRIARRWAEDRAVIEGRCPDCGAPVTLERGAWRCVRRPKARRPPCDVAIVRPDRVLAERPRVTFDPTMV